MNKTKKTITIICAAILGFLCISGFIVWLWWSNDAYQPTPEKAIKNRISFNDEHFMIVEHLDTVYFNPDAMVIYISETGEFTHVICKYNKLRKKWIVDSLGYEKLNSNELADIYNDDGTPRYGYINNYVGYFKFADGLIAYVNGVKADSKTYTVMQNGNVYKIEFWYCETDDTEITVEYRTE